MLTKWLCAVFDREDDARALMMRLDGSGEEGGGECKEPLNVKRLCEP